VAHRFSVYLSIAFSVSAAILPLEARAQTLTWGAPSSAPWVVETGSKTNPGILEELTEELARRSGIIPKIRSLPYSRVVQSVRDNELDFAYTFRSADGESFSVYPACFLNIATVAVARKGVHLKELADLKSLPQGIGVVRGANYGRDFDELTQLNRSEEPDFAQMVRKLSAGRISAVAGSSVAVFYAAKQEASQPELGDKITLSEVQFCLQIPKARAESDTTKAITKAAQSMIADKVAEAIVTKYIGQGWN
jgi:ABC-type amino acid transport substrate-binding protein